MTAGTLPPTSATPKKRTQFSNQRIWSSLAITLLALVILAIYLMPLGYGIMTSLKTKAQISDPGSPILPMARVVYNFDGQTFDVYNVPTEDGVAQWALVERGRDASGFIDPANPEAGIIEWEGRWRTLEPVRVFAPAWENYARVFESLNFLRLLGNTAYYAIVSTIGAVLSASIVAFGFARFDFRFRNFLFMLVIATVILPSQVTLVPKYAFFLQIGWVGTWLPLIVPQYFANGYNIFLMRQYFLTIPRALDEAAMLDGAGPIRIFWSVILPQAKAALLAVSLFHFFFAWNDFFEPLVYLAGQSLRYPLTIGLTFFNGVYSEESNLIQAAAIMTLIIPLIVFFFAQRTLIQGVVVTGVEK